MTKINELHALTRERIAQHLDIASRLQLAQVSKEWNDAVERSWGPKTYGLPYAHRRPVDAPDWKKACRLPLMGARLRPEDIDLPCIEMTLVAAQIDGRAGTASGEDFILRNLVRLGFYDDAVHYLETYGVPPLVDGAEPMDIDNHPVLDAAMRRHTAESILHELVVSAVPSVHLKPLLDACLKLAGSRAAQTLAELALEAQNPAVREALSIQIVPNLETVYAGLRQALARNNVASLKAYLAQYDQIGRPVLGPLLDALHRDSGCVRLLTETLLDAGITGAPCLLDAAWMLRAALEPQTPQAQRFADLFKAARGENGVTWMHLLVARQNFDSWYIARLLSEAGMSIFECDTFGTPALRGAMHARMQYASVAMLLDLAPTPWPPNFEEVRTGQTDLAHAYWQQALPQAPARSVELLRCAAWAGDTKLAHLALAYLPARLDVDQAMRCAVEKEHMPVVAMLLENGARRITDLDITRLAPDFLRQFIAAHLNFADILPSEQMDSAQIKRLCAMHTEKVPIMDATGLSLPAALIRYSRVRDSKEFWTRDIHPPLPAQEILKELLGSPADYFNVQPEFLLQRIDACATPLPADTHFSDEHLAPALARADQNPDLNLLQSAWRHHMREGDGVSALARAVFVDIAARHGGTFLTLKLAQRGMRLAAGEASVFKTWLPGVLKNGFVPYETEAIIDGLVQGGLPPTFRDSQGRTLLHLCSYGDVYDNLIANGARSDAIDFREKMAVRPDRILYLDKLT